MPFWMLSVLTGGVVLLYSLALVIKPSVYSSNCGDLPKHVAAKAGIVLGSVMLNVMLLWLIPHPYDSPEFVQVVLVTHCLTIIFWTDLLWFIIPNRVIIPMGLAALLYLSIYATQAMWVEHLISGIGLSAVLFLINLVTNKIIKKNGFGTGDIKLVLILGLWLGYQVFWVMYGAVILGGVISVIMISLHGRKKSKAVPFGTILGATFFAVQIGTYIWSN
ncbi:MAG: A24 family peptidase [Bacteroidota bacterium]